MPGIPRWSHGHTDYPKNSLVAPGDKARIIPKEPTESFVLELPIKTSLYPMESKSVILKDLGILTTTYAIDQKRRRSSNSSFAGKQLEDGHTLPD